LRATNWTRDQLLVCFNLYCRTPFGRLHKSNPDVIELACLIGRTPSAVAMKLVNFASFDPAHKQRDVKGLANASRQDRAIWDEFNQNPNALATESEEAAERFDVPRAVEVIAELAIPEGPTERLLNRPMRLVQRFFRSAVLGMYGYSCSFCGLALPELLNASHIIPWNESEELRADPRNGLCLCALHDRAFDRRLIGVDADYQLVLSPRLKGKKVIALHQVAFLDLEGQKIHLPDKFLPYATSLEQHRRMLI
jgi:putative restriction endonuclease